MRIVFLLPMMVLAACQTPRRAPAPATQTWKEFTRTRPDTFIQTYEKSIMAERRQFEQQGLAADAAVVRANVDSYLPAGDYTLQATGANAAVLRRLRVDSTTNSLLRYGYRTGQFRDPAQAKLLVKAAAGAVGGFSAGTDLALFTPIVVVAELVRVDDAADGSSTAIFRSIEPLKNAPAKGQLVRLTLRAPQQPSPYPPPPQPGEEDYRRPGHTVLFLSPPRSVGPARDQRDAYSRVTQPMAIDRDRLTPGYHSSIPELTLTALKAAIRDQVCAPGFAPVGPNIGTSLAC